MLVILMVFSAVSMVSSFEVDDNTHDLVGAGERSKTRTKQSKQLQASLRHTDAVRSRMKEERGKFVRHRPQLLYPNRKETVR